MTRTLLVCALPLAAIAWGGNDVRITIRLVNSAKLANATLAQGERQAAAVLKQAGVGVTFRECSAANCPHDLEPGEFWMNVALWKPAGTCGETLGFTTVDRDSGGGARVAGVYYPMVRQMAEYFGLDEVFILGAVLAHEIGHLLGVGHSPAGVMSAAFDRRRIVEMRQGALQFGRDEASRMRFEALRWTTGSSGVDVAVSGSEWRVGQAPAPAKPRSSRRQAKRPDSPTSLTRSRWSRS